MDCANEKLPKNECRITLFGRKQEYLSYILTDLLTALRQYCVQTLRKIFGLGCICTIQQKEDGLFFLFASKVFQERHCAPSPLRMYRYGKQGRLSFQDCKPPCYICPICVWCVLFRIPLKLRPYKVPLLQHGESGRLLRKVRILPTRSWRLRLYRPA